ncbi:MAG: HAMP domain-containing protein, partial [Candidatus Zixiibacteriota bacterium]
MFFRRPIKEINAEFPAEERYLGSIQRIVREACATAGMSRRQISSVQLALEEGATNIIRHAYLYEKGALRLRIVIYRKLIVFSLIDTGRSFQPAGSATLDLEKLVESGRRGGLGFYMIQKIMDSVEYISSGGRNELRMVKRLHGTPASSAPLLRRLWSLRMKFSVGTLLVVSLIVLIAFYFIDRNSTGRVRRQLDETVTALSKTIADQASGYILNHRSPFEFDELVRSYVHSNPDLRQVILIDSTGRMLANSGEELAGIGTRYVPPARVDTLLTGQPQHLPGKAKNRNVLVMAIKSGRLQLGRVFVFYSAERLEAQLRSARLQALLVTGLLLLIGVVGIFLLSSYFVTPIVEITRRVRRYTSGDLETELPLEGAEEFFEISRALNEMTTRLSRDRKHLVERERLAKEIEVASQIQQTLLPRQLPAIPGLEVDAFYRAASLVGGDLYDVFEIDGGRYCLV